MSKRCNDWISIRDHRKIWKNRILLLVSLYFILNTFRQGKSRCWRSISTLISFREWSRKSTGLPYGKLLKMFAFTFLMLSPHLKNKTIPNNFFSGWPSYRPSSISCWWLRRKWRIPKEGTSYPPWGLLLFNHSIPKLIRF